MNPYSIVAKGAAEAELFVYGDIGGFVEESVHAAKLVKQLSELKASRITLRINSWGGAVSDALAIYNALRKHKATVHSIVEGVAVSAASLIPMGSDTISMHEASIMMIHGPRGMVLGPAKDLRELADVLDKFAAAMAPTYAARSGKPEADIMRMLTDGEDHWFLPEEAKAEGFADTVLEAQSATAAQDLDWMARYEVPHNIAASLRRRKPDMKTSLFPSPTTTPDAVDAERSRCMLIREHCDALGLEASMADALIRDAVPIDESRRRILDAVAARTDEVQIRSQAALHGSGGSPIQAMAEALAVRAGVVPTPSEHAREFVSMSTVDMARFCLERSGTSTQGWGGDRVIRAAFAGGATTFSFPELLLGTGERALRRAYEAASSGVIQLSRAATANDFRVRQKLALSEAPELEKVPEHGEIRRGSMSETKESYKLETFAKIFGMTRQALVNDDLGAFQMLAAFGRAAAEKIAQILVDLLTANAGAGPTMGDGVALFHSDHGNLAGSGAAIDLTTLGAARLAMRSQKGLDGKTPVNVLPKFLLIPAALETLAEQHLTTIAASQASNVNPFGGRLELVVDPRLDAVSATAWYLSADPAVNDVVEHAFLDGADGPLLDTREGFDIDGIEWRCRLDFGAGALDWRGLYRNPGA